MIVSGPGGETGRRTGLKIPSRVSGVPVRVRPGAPSGGAYSPRHRENGCRQACASRLRRSCSVHGPPGRRFVRRSRLRSRMSASSDAKGKPVRGLTKDESEIFEGGKLRGITNFSGHGPSGESPGTSFSLAGCDVRDLEGKDDLVRHRRARAGRLDADLGRRDRRALATDRLRPLEPRHLSERR
jgi:hypothetical protein